MYLSSVLFVLIIYLVFDGHLVEDREDLLHGAVTKVCRLDSNLHLSSLLTNRLLVLSLRGTDLETVDTGNRLFSK